MTKDIINNFLSFLVGALFAVIGIMFTINTYVFDLQNKQLELERLLHDVEVAADYGEKFKQMNQKISSLEVYLNSIEGIRPYYNGVYDIPPDIDKKRELVKRLNSTPASFSKKEIIDLMMSFEHQNISKTAARVFLNNLNDEDLNLATKLAIHPFRSDSYSYAAYLVDKLTPTNISHFEKAWFMYAKLDEQMASMLLERVIDKKLIKNRTLRNMYTFSKNNDLKYCLKLIESLLVNSHG